LVFEVGRRSMQPLGHAIAGSMGKNGFTLDPKAKVDAATAPTVRKVRRSIV
jgi:hypothetical protein